jgi:replication-associated recombination protein RarA
VIGHEHARHILERELPQATLLHGPSSIGKWTMARYLADHHRVAPIDRWEVPQGLTIETVRLVAAYAARAPHGKFKLIVVRLDDSTPKALHALLKTLEEPPPSVRFLLTSTESTLPTVASRCMVFELGLLSVEQLEALYRTQGLSASKAQRAAHHARGQVKRGYEAERADHHRNQVINLAKALAASDHDLYAAVFTGWENPSTDMLSTFLTECLTQRWSTFTEADSFGLHHDRTRLWRMVAALTRLKAARNKLGVRTALEPFLRR